MHLWREESLLVDVEAAFGIGKRVILPKSPQERLAQNASIGGTAEAVVAVGDLAHMQRLGGAGPELKDVG